RIRQGPAQEDKLTESIRQRLEHLVPELVKKTFAAGLGAVYSTEEGIRKLARDGLPELAGYVASSADSAKDKVWEIVARETRDFLRSEERRVGKECRSRWSREDQKKKDE